MQKDFLFKLFFLLVLSIVVKGAYAQYDEDNEIRTFTDDSVIINTNNPEAIVYMDKVEVGKGSVVKIKKDKKRFKEIIIRTPGYKDEVYLILPKAKVFNLPCKTKITKRLPNQKYLEFDKVSFTKIDTGNHRVYSLNYSDSLEKRFENENSNKRVKTTFNNYSNSSNSNDYLLNCDEKLKAEIFKTIRRTSFGDTVDHVFPDINNTLKLSANVKKYDYFIIQYTEKYDGAIYNKFFVKIKLHIRWTLSNYYGEAIDSVDVADYSSCIRNFDAKTDYCSIYSDIIETSYLNLLTMNVFKNHMKYDSIQTAAVNSVISIKKSAHYVENQSDASNASVIVKNKGKGHGSGFAVSSDGYLITNFHVISGETFDKFGEITVILSNGEELPAKVIRCNRELDIALLKIDYSFEKPFQLVKEKNYTNLSEVYTIGAPISIELGQSLSKGMISNERKIRNKYLLQLNMAVSPGNSGGALFSINGALQGIVVSKLVGFATEGVCFAIPGFLINSNLKVEYN